MRIVLPIMLTFFVLFAVYSVSFAQRDGCNNGDLKETHGMVIKHGFTASGKYLEDISCMDLFIDVERSYPYCDDGNWVESESPCKEAFISSCILDNPPSTDHGRVKAGFGGHGTVASYECEEGFVLEKSSEVRCFFSVWKGAPPKCIYKRCEDEPPTIEHGVFKDYDGDHNSIVEYECDEGFVMEDPKSSEVRCVFGEWKGDLPNCRIKRCEYEPPPIEHGVFKDYDGDHNSTVEYECDEGFVMEDPKSNGVRCLFGEWEGDPPICQSKEITESKKGIDEEDLQDKKDKMKVSAGVEKDAIKLAERGDAKEKRFGILHILHLFFTGRIEI